MNRKHKPTKEQELRQKRDRSHKRRHDNSTSQPTFAPKRQKIYLWKPPQFAQIYKRDTENEIANRIKWNNNLNTSVVQFLQDMLHGCNPFIDIFKSTVNLIKNTKESNQSIKLVLHADTTKDEQRYNLPTCSEVSVIMPGEVTTEPTHRNIILYKNSTSHHKGYEMIHINENHPKYDPLHYVLLMPPGQDGWTIGIKSPNQKSQISAMQFYAYHLMVRDNFNILLRGGRLLQQYIVDMFAKIEQERLNYCLYHQHELRAELYQGLSDAINSGDTDGVTVGKKNTPPSSFSGSPRNMHEQYQDAMSIVLQKGFPKEFRQTKLQTWDGYPLYKRSDNAITIEKHGVILDNRWVVLYNPYLCIKYSAHINFEICSSVKAVKYLNKYVYKGHDKIMAGIQTIQADSEDHNEITQFVDARYVSASEGSWRIFHYDLHNRSPAIQRLAVHLPGQEQIVYTKGKAPILLRTVIQQKGERFYNTYARCNVGSR
ncbi:unnamed protein product [Mytilus coruscus]|uniref:Helitron helicase-like domain-containing protein n=1 Tax=Mytilus coruscus TaxID=42192 RepID=A0A6J8BKY6_MYTCO|nr:unnamed protein product [Mytilus coruscus]